MADGDIKIGLGNSGFRFHDIAIAVVGFGDDCFSPGLRAGDIWFISQRISVRMVFLLSSMVVTFWGLSGSVVFLTA